ncbi:MAG TPA: hypothetical protein DF610_16770 [Sphingobacterium sp.]|nr:hypothetical protein [Sphingobacterium sp.]
MPEKQKINILWFGNDLRIRDNESLFNVMQEDLPFLALYIFDETFFCSAPLGFKKIGKFRAQFLLDTVLDLNSNLQIKKIFRFLKKLDELRMYLIKFRGNLRLKKYSVKVNGLKKKSFWIIKSSVFYQV